MSRWCTRGAGGGGARRRRLVPAECRPGYAVTAALPPLPRGSTVTVGSFDGVHLGHQAVLPRDRAAGRRRGAGERAGDLRAASARGGEPAGRAAAAHDRPPSGARSWRSCRSTTCSSCGSTGAWRRSRPRSSCSEVLLDRCGMRELVIGHDHGFGRGRSGDVETLRRLGGERGFEVDVVEPVDVGEQHVSSTRIRRAVAGGDLATAARHAGPALPGERAGGPRRAAGTDDRRPDDQPGRGAARRSCCRPTVSTRCGSSGAAAAPAG